MDIESACSIKELNALVMKVMEVSNVPGCIIEFGVWKGGSIIEMAKVEPNKQIYGVDSFEGMEIDFDDITPKGHFKYDIEKVKKNCEPYKNVSIIKGHVPEILEMLKDKTFSLVHIDLDDPKAILYCLRFVYGRINDGGILSLHDFCSPVAGKGIDAFFNPISTVVKSFKFVKVQEVLK